MSRRRLKLKDLPQSFSKILKYKEYEEKKIVVQNAPYASSSTFLVSSTLNNIPNVAEPTSSKTGNYISCNDTILKIITQASDKSEEKSTNTGFKLTNGSDNKIKGIDIGKEDVSKKFKNTSIVNKNEKLKLSSESIIPAPPLFSNTTKTKDEKKENVVDFEVTKQLYNIGNNKIEIPVYFSTTTNTTDSSPNKSNSSLIELESKTKSTQTDIKLQDEIIFKTLKLETYTQTETIPQSIGEKIENKSPQRRNFLKFSNKNLKMLLSPHRRKSMSLQEISDSDDKNLNKSIERNSNDRNEVNSFVAFSLTSSINKNNIKVERKEESEKRKTVNVLYEKRKELKNELEKVDKSIQGKEFLSNEENYLISSLVTSSGHFNLTSDLNRNSTDLDFLEYEEITSPPSDNNSKVTISDSFQIDDKSKILTLTESVSINSIDSDNSFLVDYMKFMAEGNGSTIKNDKKIEETSLKCCDSYETDGDVEEGSIYKLDHDCSSNNEKRSQNMLSVSSLLPHVNNSVIKRIIKRGRLKPTMSDYN